jgi:tripartite-type tricarboxylate transporter receptor subunit TctC
MLVVHPSLPVRTVHDFVILARNRPGVINYASTGNGTLPHLAAEFLRIQAKVKLVHVAYKGSAPAMTDLLGGEVEMFFGNVLSVLPMVNAGRLRALAVTSLQRQSVSPKVPTVAESGFPGFEVVTWFGLMLPGATQRDIVVKLQNEMIKVTKLPDIQEKLSVQGASTIGNTSEQFAAYIKTESDKWAKVLKVSGIKIEQ